MKKLLAVGTIIALSSALPALSAQCGDPFAKIQANLQCMQEQHGALIQHHNEMIANHHKAISELNQTIENQRALFTELQNNPSRANEPAAVPENEQAFVKVDLEGNLLTLEINLPDVEKISLSIEQELMVIKDENETIEVSVSNNGQLAIKTQFVENREEEHQGHTTSLSTSNSSSNVNNLGVDLDLEQAECRIYEGGLSIQIPVIG